ncbi:hypothetical protein [Yoonia sp. R2-816]|uniref:hypothetical protein n=1 Tax=Yoonia sp. R2-816 TaxID=3342638 RepID=UPI003727A0AA
MRGLSPSPYGPKYVPGEVASHADLFGPVAIAIDPLAARRIGIVPTSYYSPSDTFGEKYEGGFDEVPGLNYQIISRLKELREIMIVLAHVEGGLTKKGYTFPNFEELASLEHDLPYDPALLDKVNRMRDNEKNDLFDLFDLDREPAFNLVGFIEMMLNLFQQTDSSLNEDILAFYQQREFRLIHHMRKGMVWYSLGSHPEFLNPLKEAKSSEIKDLRKLVSDSRTEATTERYFQRCWQLESVDGHHVRDFIEHVVAPRSDKGWICEEFKRHDIHVTVLEAEEYGYGNP